MFSSLKIVTLLLYKLKVSFFFLELGRYDPLSLLLNKVFDQTGPLFELVSVSMAELLLKCALVGGALALLFGRLPLRKY